MQSQVSGGSRTCRRRGRQPLGGEGRRPNILIHFLKLKKFWFVGGAPGASPLNPPLQVPVKTRQHLRCKQVHTNVNVCSSLETETVFQAKLFVTKFNRDDESETLTFLLLSMVADKDTMIAKVNLVMISRYSHKPWQANMTICFSLFIDPVISIRST